MRPIAILLNLLLLSTVTLFAQKRQYQFASVDVNKGLSHNSVNDIIRDKTGFLWFATQSGLNRFDGYAMKVFRNDPADTTSLLNNDVTRVFEGPAGRLWIYTHAGNTIYNPGTETFLRNINPELAKLGISAGVITFMKRDSRNRFWFIHYNQGLFVYDPSTRQTTRYQHEAGDEGTIGSMVLSELDEDISGNIWIVHQNGSFEKMDSTGRVVFRSHEIRDLFAGQLLEYHITCDSDGDVWIYSNSNHGCFFYQPANNTLTSINTSSSVRLTSNIVRKIVENTKGEIWVATDHGGINVIDKQKDFKVHLILHDEEDGKSLAQNSINAMYRDSDGIIWVGTYKKGISYYHDNIYRFDIYRHSSASPGGLPFNDVNAFAEDEKGNIWIGTNGGGLIYFDRKSNRFTQYKHDPSNANSLSSNVIVSLHIDHENALWIGTYYGGLNRFDGKRFIHYKHDPSDPASIGDDSVWEILEDSKHNLWIGTLRGGVDVYDRSKGEFFHYRNGDFNSIRTTYVPALMEDSEGNMWIGTGYGVDVLEKTSGRFVHYLNDVSDPASISNNSILSLLEDSRGLIWVGTHGGLNLFDRQKKTFLSLQEKDGLPHNSILTMAEDPEGNLWMGTPNGLSKLTLTRGDDGYKFAFRNYEERDGLQGKAFNENAVLRCASGELVFGGSNGFNVFDPSKIAVNPNKPRVILTDLQVFNKSVTIAAPGTTEAILPRSVTEIKEITLRHADNIFSIEFAALNFLHPEKSQYQYMLEGFNREWLNTSAMNRKVTFTNLDPGEYVFKVRASNHDGVWNEVPTSVRITIQPPFWKSNIAFVLYALGIIAALLLARWIILTRERMNFRIEQERQEAQRMHELDMMKIKFFTNVSHEFRTPLTLILTPIEKLLKQTADEGQRDQFQLIHRNARRLLNLVNQLLDFRKMEVQEVRFNPSEGDIVGFIRDLAHSFSDLSEKKNIAFSFRSSVPQLETFFDQDKVEKILFNLLSNAFKFTPENGAVSVDLNVKKDADAAVLEIKVSDTGIGIPADKQDRVFERFFQHDIPQSMVNQGSGIGLSITREFVKVHGGIITLESEPGKGSCFTVLLPVPEIIGDTSVVQESLAVIAGLETEPEEGEHQKPVLLIVEDNEDFRFYLKDNLRIHYQVLEAANGKQGLQKALAVMPDLIVSDVMMPEMNGIELCRKVKNDPHTSHIPVILLTARTAEEQKLEGFETGASDYITKPFNFEILQSRIRNLIAQRQAFQKHFSKHLDVKASDIQITSMDEKLIQNAVKIVEDHISDPEFSVEELSRELGMSRVHLYKKLLSLTGKSPIEFIRIIRLQRAAQLLEKSQLTVAEVAYKVGFNNPKYFTKYFKDEFNILPSAYASGKRMPV